MMKHALNFWRGGLDAGHWFSNLNLCVQKSDNQGLSSNTKVTIKGSKLSFSEAPIDMDHSAGAPGKRSLVHADQKPESLIKHLLNKFSPPE